MENEFNVIENFSSFNIEAFNEVLEGKSAVYILRKYFDESELLNVKEAFLSILRTTNGGNRSRDFVPVFQVGATQFNKETKEYFEECGATYSNIQQILMSIKNKDKRDDFLLEETLYKTFRDKDIRFRPSSFLDKSVNQFTIRQWKNSNDEGLSLLPHEDLSQLTLAHRDGYEIGRVRRVVASNLCISNSFGGDLIVWNYEPDYDTKVSLGVQSCGYPYSIPLLQNRRSVELKINPGDLYFINANLIHAVKEVKGGERITAGRFIGKISDKEIVYWT